MLNRRVGRLRLFEKPADYAAFEKILHQDEIRRVGSLFGQEENGKG